MPRSSRHKSHKQHKHSSKDSKETREYSDSEEVGNFKDRKDREEVAVRVSRESGSSEKRKLVVSQRLDGNGEEYSASKRRKERSDGGGGDRWNGGNKEAAKGESSRIDLEKGLKSKVSVDSKNSKSSRRHESSSEKKESKEVKEVNPGLVVESEEVKKSSSSNSKIESKSNKSEMDSSRKETHQYKDKDSKDKEHVVERISKAQDVRQERSVDKGAGKGVVDGEVNRKQSSHLEERSTKQEVGNTELMKEGSRNPELDKELEKWGRRKRDGSDEKDKYVGDVRDSNGRRSSTKNERHRDDKHKDDRYKDKYREDLDRDHRNRDDRVRDDRSSKDHISDRSDPRHSRDENKSVVENRHKKSKTQNSDHDGSPHLPDDRGTRYNDYRVKKRSSDDEDRNDLKPRNSKEHRYEVEKKVNSGKVESLADRGRSQSRLADGDSTVSASRRKSSPSSGSHFPKDSFRQSSKQAELKYKDPVSEERVRAKLTSSRDLTTASGIPERDSESRSTDKPKSVGKPNHKDKNHLVEVSSEKPPIPDMQVSPLQLKEKSHTSTSIDRRHSSRTPVRRNIDVDETVHRSSSFKDVRDYPGNDDRGSQEWPLEKPAVDEFSQADGDTVSISSSFNRTSHFPRGSSPALPPPPPIRTGVDSPSVFSHFEEDRGKSSNRYKRSGDPNVGRGQGNAWKGSPNWSTPVTNGFIPFQQGPPPGGFHPMIPHFHGPPIFGVRPSMELNTTGVSYHIPDGDRYPGHVRSFPWRNRADEACPPHIHGWDGSNGAYGDEAHMHGKSDWDQNRHMMSDRGWESSIESWKGQNNGIGMDFPSATRKEDNQLRAPVDEVWDGKPGQRSRNEHSRSVSRAESNEIKISDDIDIPSEPIEDPKPIFIEKSPEPSKMLIDNGFRHYYLAKLDISLGLTHPELYKQCMSILDMEGNSTDGDVTKSLSIEEDRKAGVKISNSSLNAPLFPMIKDSVMQRAMTLYKKQGEEMKVKFPVSSFFGARLKTVPTKDGEKEKLYSDLTIIDQKPEPVPFLPEKTEEVIPTPTQMITEELDPVSDNDKADEPMTASNNEKVESPVPYSGEEIAEDAFPYSDKEKRDEAIPNCGEEVVEPVPSLGNDEPEEQVISVIVEKMDIDAITTFNVDNLELAEDHSLQHALQSTINSSIKTEDSDMASAGSLAGNKAFSDGTVCGFVGVTDDTEACEALAPMPIECKLVNLSRIHSPESTH